MNVKDKTLDLGVAFVTGRAQFRNVLETYFGNWKRQELLLNPKVRLHLIVVYDVKYTNTPPEVFRDIPGDIVDSVASVSFYGRQAIEREIAGLTSRGILDDSDAELLFGSGYARKRNVALYAAFKKKLDRLLFIDDDEYPLAVRRDAGGNLLWTGQDVTSTHLKFSEYADITHGHHCGYISPIPAPRFDRNLSEADFRAFIEAISNDIVSWPTVKSTIIENHGVTYAMSDIVENEWFNEVREVKGMKFISGANLCLNLNRMKKIPVFFNPPGARGEDAFMSTMLSDKRVLKVPCYTFHDGFAEYRELLNGVLPRELTAVDESSMAIRKRFAKATLGWIRYKPLLTYITDRPNYEKVISRMQSNLERTIPKICRHFNMPDFEQILDELAEYHSNVSAHHTEFLETQRAWRKLTEHPETIFPTRLPRISMVPTTAPIDTKVSPLLTGKVRPLTN